MRLTTSHVADVGGSVSEVQFDGAPMINGNATDCESANCRNCPAAHTISSVPFGGVLEPPGQIISAPSMKWSRL